MNNAHTGSFSNRGFSVRGNSGSVSSEKQSIIQLSNLSQWPFDLSYPAVSVGGEDWGGADGFHGFCFPRSYEILRVFGMIHYYKKVTTPGSLLLRFRKVWADGSMSVPITPPTGTLLGNVSFVLPVTDASGAYYFGFDSGDINWSVSSNFLFYGYVSTGSADDLYGLSCSAIIEWEE